MLRSPPPDCRIETASPVAGQAIGRLLVVLATLAALAGAAWGQQRRLDRGIWLDGQSLAFTDGVLALSNNPAGLATAKAWELHLRTGLWGAAVAGDRGAGYGLLAGLPLGPFSLAFAAEHAADPAPAVAAKPGLADLSRFSVGAGSRFGGWFDLGLAWRGQYGQAASVGDLGTIDLGLQLSPWAWLTLGVRVSDLLGVTTFALPEDSDAVLGPNYGWGWAVRLLDDQFIWAMDVGWPGDGFVATIDGNLQFRARDGWGFGVEWRLHDSRSAGGGDSRVGLFVRHEADHWGLSAAVHRDDNPYNKPATRVGFSAWVRHEPAHSAWQHVLSAVTGRPVGPPGDGLSRKLASHRVGWKGPLSGASNRRAAMLARAMLDWSAALVEEDIERLCAALAPGEVRFDIETHDPELVLHRSYGREEACLSLARGELKSYVREFGPAFLHAEAALTLPHLFRIHGSAYFRLPQTQNQAYVEHLARVRRGRPALRCTRYRANPLAIRRPPPGSAQPARRVYEVELGCAGVHHYVVQFEGDAKAGFKLRKFSVSF